MSLMLPATGALFTWTLKTFKKIEILDAGNGKEIQPVARTTATSGSEFGLFQQLFGNIGRFNTPDGSGDAPAR